MPTFELITKDSILDFYNWLRGSYGEDNKVKIEESFKDFNWSKASEDYSRKIEKNFNQIKLIGSDSPIKLNEIFTDVYLLKNSDAFEYHKTLDNNQTDTQKKRFNGSNFVKEGHKFIYILGKPGSGKTTFLKYTAVKASIGEIKGIPVLIYLKDWSRTRYNLLDYLLKEFKVCKFPVPAKLIEFFLETGKFIILLDGLDEVPQSQQIRSKIIQEIKDFSRNYHENQFLLTCRIAATDYTFQQFTYLRMADFTPNQINTYIKNWFKGKSKIKQKLFKTALFDPNNKRFLEMATQPLLLSLLCINFNETMTFSERRIDIYEEAIGILIEKWSANNEVVREEFIELSKARKMQMFSEIAYENFIKDKDFDRFPKKVLENQITSFISKVAGISDKVDIDGEKILESIEANNSILIERYKHVFSFGHLSFQEYFTARYISEKDARIKNLLVPPNIYEDRWREVILNTASLLSDADDFFSYFLESINSIFVARNSGKEELFSLLTQISIKSKSVESKRSNRSIRFFYLYLLLLEARSRYICDNPLEADLTLNKIDSVLSQIRYLNPDSDLNRALKHAFGNTRDIVRDFPQSIDRGVIPDSDPEIAFDYQIVIFSFAITSFYYYFRLTADNSSRIVQLNNFLQDAISKTNFLRDSSLIKAVEEISLLTETFGLAEFTKIKIQIDSILKIRQIYTDIDFLKNDFIQTLNQFLISNSLIIECLNLASVSNRKSIENKILLPPENIRII